jgi:hypothetical protein
MNEVALWTGSVVCHAGLTHGISGFQCYEQLPLLTIGWSTGALVLVVVVLITERAISPS